MNYFTHVETPEGNQNISKLRFRPLHLRLFDCILVGCKKHSDILCSCLVQKIKKKKTEKKLENVK